MKGTNEFIQEDLDFLRDLNAAGTHPITATINEGYLRNFNQPELQQLENLTKRVFDPNFVLCFSCSHEIMEMVKRVMAKYEAEQGEELPTDLDERGTAKTVILTQEMLDTFPTQFEGKEVGESIKVLELSAEDVAAFESAGFSFAEDPTIGETPEAPAKKSRKR